jgi:hypothetical protein
VELGRLRNFQTFGFGLVVAILLGFAMVGSAFAQSVTGLVTNKTTNKPAAGDDVVLLKLAQGMQELTRTKSDAHGRFTLKIPAEEVGSVHLVRVNHDGANYFSPAPPGTNKIDVDVYTAAKELDSVLISEDVLQIQTTPDGGSLRVTEHYLLRNDSQPQMTLFSEHPFELYLPAGAVVDGASAKAPGGMGVEQPLVPMGDPNHYTIIFPIRPGETEFNVWYHIPYKDSFAFLPRPTLPVEAFGIMMPRGMTFKAGTGADFKSVSEQVGGKAQAFLAQSVKPSQPLGFTVSGKGELPRDTVAQSQSNGAQTGAAADNNPNTDTKPGGGLGTPLDKDADRESWVSKYKWWMIVALGLLLAIGAGVMLGMPTRTGNAPGLAGGQLAVTSTPLEVLRDEMFAVETDRLEGRLTEAEYAELKAAYDVVLRRTLTRSGARNAPRSATEETEA